MNLELAIKDLSIFLCVPKRDESSGLQALMRSASSDLMFLIPDLDWGALTRGDALELKLPPGSWRSILHRLTRSHDFWRAPENRKKFPTQCAPKSATEDELGPLTFTMAGVVYDDSDKVPGLPESVLELGSFELKSSTMLATDPCYEKGTWCTIEFSAQPGTWNARVRQRDDNCFGMRNALLIVAHDSVDINTVNVEGLEELDGSVGVDSGQAGFFDKESYPQDPDAPPAPKPEADSNEIVMLIRGEDDEPTGMQWKDGKVVPVEEPAAASAPTTEDYLFEDDEDDDTSTKSWYDRVCDVTLEDSTGNAGIAPDGFGAVSQTFWGDGGYPCFVRCNEAGEVIAAVVVFDGSASNYESEE